MLDIWKSLRMGDICRGIVNVTYCSKKALWNRTGALRGRVCYKIETIRFYPIVANIPHLSRMIALWGAEWLVSSKHQQFRKRQLGNSRRQLRGWGTPRHIVELLNCGSKGANSGNSSTDPETKSHISAMGDPKRLSSMVSVTHGTAEG
jgi:hypothetical protein